MRRSTERYFHDHAPEYSLHRYRPVVEFLRQDASGDASLVDLGCGSGNVLAHLTQHLPLRLVVGVDLDPAYLEQCAATVPGCRTHLGSVLDDDLHQRLGSGFRYVLLGAVVHHLVASTRRGSLALTRAALAGAWRLVEPGGCLIVVEPTFRPRWAMTVLFHVKRAVSALTPRRVPILGHWNNIGAPVVSYYSHEALVAEGLRLPGSEMALSAAATKPISLQWRLAGITARADSVVAIRKAAG